MMLHQKGKKVVYTSYTLSIVLRHWLQMLIFFLFEEHKNKVFSFFSLFGFLAKNYAYRIYVLSVTCVIRFGSTDELNCDKHRLIE